MRPMTIARSNVPRFLAALSECYRVVAPRRVGSDVVLADFTEGDPVEWAFVNTAVPPKTLFFPPRESLFHVEGTTRPALRAPAPEKPVAIFGMRSCDATGAAFLERFFPGRGFVDEAVVGRIAAHALLVPESPGPARPDATVLPVRAVEGARLPEASPADASPTVRSARLRFIAARPIRASAVFYDRAGGEYSNIKP